MAHRPSAHDDEIMEEPARTISSPMSDGKASGSPDTSRASSSQSRKKETGKFSMSWLKRGRNKQQDVQIDGIPDADGGEGSQISTKSGEDSSPTSRGRQSASNAAESSRHSTSNAGSEGGERNKHVGKGIAHKTIKGQPYVVRGTHGAARASECNLTMQGLWEMFDADRDGWLTEHQVLDALQAVGISLDDEEVKELRREMEEELEVWSDDEDSEHSDSEVSSDGGEYEIVYEDYRGEVMSMQRDPRDTEHLWIMEGGGEASRAAHTFDRAKLDRERPDDFDLWAAATVDPGVCMDETLMSIKARADFVRRIHFCQEMHETGGYDSEREAFAVAWSDRTLDESETHNKLRSWMALLWAPVRWWRSRGVNKAARLAAAEAAKKEEDKRRKELLKVQLRPPEQRVKNAFVKGLAHLDEEARSALIMTVFKDMCSSEDQMMDETVATHALRRLGVFATMYELADMASSVGGTVDDDRIALSAPLFVRMVDDLLLAVLKSAQQDKIVVDVFEASDLPAVDRFESADPYVTVSIFQPVTGETENYLNLEDGIVESASTKILKQTLNPEWNETLTLVKFNMASEILIQVQDYDPSGFGSALIGQLSFTVRDLMSAPQVNSNTTCIHQWFELEEEDGRKIVGNYGSYSKLHAKVNYTRGELEAQQVPQHITGLYAQIKLTVVNAEHLPKMDKTAVGSVDAYCIISFADQRFKTRTVRHSYEPEWNQTFTIIAKDPVGEIHLQMLDWDPEGRDDSIGTCKIPLALLKSGDKKELYDLRTLEESTFVIGHDKQRAQVRVHCEYVSVEDLAANLTPLEILFTAITSDHVPTVLEASSALWGMLHGDKSINVREGLASMDTCWQDMAKVFMFGWLEIDVIEGQDFPRMDYFGLCDPYVKIMVDGFTVTTEVIKTTLNPVWEAHYTIPVFKDPQDARSAIMIDVECFDWDKRSAHDLIGSFSVKLEHWEFGGPEEEWFTILGREEVIPSLHAGEAEQIVRRPIIGHTGKPSRLRMKVRYIHRPAASDECTIDMAWAVSLAVLDHPSNATKFCETIGGVSGLVAMLKKPLDPKDGKGDAQQAAAYAIGNITAAHPPAQLQFASFAGIEALLKLIPAPASPIVQRAACLCLANVLQNNPKLILKTLSIDRGNRQAHELVRGAGGIGVLLMMIQQARPDPALLQKEGGDVAWDDVALATEAAVQALAGACFVQKAGLFSEGKRTVEKVAKAVGRPGILVLRRMARMPVKTSGGKRATADGVRFAQLCYESLESAYGLS